MRYSITHHGVPIGTVDLTVDGGRGDGVVTVLPAYKAIRALVQRATQAVTDVRNHSRTARLNRRERFREAAELTRELALQDEHGQVVETDYIVLRDESDAEPPVLTAIGVHNTSDA